MEQTLSHGGSAPPQRKLCLLSLDGGGVRGLSSLCILEELMRKVDPENPPKPCEYFDLIGGTSTGGLIAIMLGRLQMTIEDCRVAYRELSDEAFQLTNYQAAPALRWPWNWDLKARFDSAALEKGIKRIIVKALKERRENESKSNEQLEDTLLKELNFKCRVFVTATSASMPDRTSILTNYVSDRWPQDLLNSVKIWEAGRATSAASTFFMPVEIGPDNEVFLDGATGANNPVNVVWDEARDIWKSDKPLEDDVQCFVSIGTGVPAVSGFGQSLKEIGETIKNMATETEATANSFMRRFTKLHSEQRYFRFNVRSGLEHIGLEESSKRSDIVAATRRYLTSEEEKKQLESCADNLRLREWQRCVSIFLHQTLRGYDCVKELKQASAGFLLNDCDAEESIAWFVQSIQCRRWMTEEHSKLLGYVVPEGFDSTRVISKFLQGLRSHNSTLDCAIAYVDLSRHEGNNSQDTQSLVIRSVIYQLFVRSPQPEQMLHGLFKEMRHDANSFWQLVDPSKGLCPLRYLTRALAYVTSQLGSDAVTLIILNVFQKAAKEALGPLLDFFNQKRNLGTNVRTLLCTHPDDDVLDILKGNLILGRENEISWCTSSLKFQEWEHRRKQVELPLKNTNEWIWNHPAFGAWGKAGGVLWITGKPGSGKSTIARMITERLVPSPEPNADACDVPGASRSLPSVVASFFYSSRLGATAMGHDYMLRSILYQVLTQNQALYRHFQSTYRKLIQEQYGLSTWHFRNSGQDDRDQINEALNLLQHKDLPVSWTIEALENVFENIAEEIEANQTKIYCILDGFDESDEGSVSVSWQNESMSVRRRTLYWLTELSLRKVAVDWLRVIVLSRPTADIKFAQAGFNNIIVEEHNGPAIEKIVNYRLTSISRTMRKWESVHSGQNLDRSSPNLESWEDYPGPTLTTLRSIRAQILKRANHTILWVVLVLKELEFTLGKSGVYSLEDVDKTLKSLPEGLEELYKELISRLCARRSKAELLKARHMIMWACFAKRPLSLLEFQDAVAATSWTGPSDLSFAEHLNRNRVQLFNQTNFAPIEQDIINSCGCLLEVVKLGYRYQDGDVVLTFKVQITHQTVLDLVLRQDRSAEPFYWSRDEAENQISSAIHHYLVHCTETRSCLPEPEMGSSFVQDGIMPLFNHVHCHQLLNYILQNRHCGSVPIWQANDPIPLTMRNLTHTLPGPQKHSAGHEDINIYITSMLNSMEQARKQWNRSNFNIWSNAPADPNDKSRPKKGSSRLGTELVFSKPSNMYTGNEIFSPRTEPSPKFAMAVAANFPRHNATLQARDTAVHLSPGESRASSRSPVQTSDMTESSSRNSPSNDHRQTRARCYKCRQRGHLVKNCPQRARRPISRNT